MKNIIHTELRAGQTLKIGDAVLTLVDKSGKKARLTIVAPQETRISVPHRAQECAPKQEQAHGQHSLRQSTPAIP